LRPRDGGILQDGGGDRERGQQRAKISRHLCRKRPGAAAPGAIIAPGPHACPARGGAHAGLHHVRPAVPDRGSRHEARTIRLAIIRGRSSED
jgi:hypothetical protein